MSGQGWIQRIIGGLAVPALVVLVTTTVTGCETAPPPERAPGPTPAAPRPSGAGIVTPERLPTDRPPAAPPMSPPGGAPLPASTGGTAAGGAPEDTTCPPDGILLREGTGDAAMGLRVESIELFNCGTVPYELNGYPDIRLLDERKSPVEVQVGHGSNGISTGTGFDEAPGRVTVLPGRSASFGLLWRNLVTESTVPATEGRHLEVQPRPGAPRRTLTLTRPVDLGNTGKLGLGPWKELPR
ncbi:DUF4232 domain-containing protein [Streptomyces sp. NPDC089799]|uniref:DUF4232 domain-containing protein n=1 Tax=Streptomyces sp. NPDC089799 TaxID=3155066 RepID=UPI00341F7263